MTELNIIVILIFLLNLSKFIELIGQLPVYVRVNTLNNTLEHIILQFQKEGWHLLPFCKTYAEHVIKVANIGQEEFMRDFHIPEVLIFPPGTNFRNHFGLYLGNFFIQDKVFN